MHRINDPGQMTGEQRFHEIIAILARAFARWKKRAMYAPDSGKPAEICRNPSKSGDPGLELSSETRLSVRGG